jgi:hypothetical protein
MEQVPVRSWKAEFARSTEAERYREISRRAKEEIRKRDRDDEKGGRDHEVLEHLGAMVVMATEAELTEFSQALVVYETATYEALIENESELDKTRLRLDEIYQKAYVLPDGRRLFESEDGLHVFDEHGLELGASDITPEEIEDWRPRAEVWRAEVDTVNGLLEERQQIINFQDAVRDARQRVEDGDRTKQELEDLKASLAEQIPDRVEGLLPDVQRPATEPAYPTPGQTSEASWRPSVKLDLPSL